MGTKERQDRERQAVTASILDAARDLFVAEGYQSVSIRKIAERIEYSPEHQQAAREAIRVGSAILRGDIVDHEVIPVTGPRPLGVTSVPSLVFGPFIKYRVTAADRVDSPASREADRQIAELTRP